MSRNIAQMRAADALAKIKKLEDDGEAKYGKYRSYVDALPAAIVMNGLGQAMATELAASEGKATNPHHLLYDHVASWLSRDDEDAPYRKAPDLMQAIVTNNEDKYLMAQAEALAYLEWLKKFADAYLKKVE